MDHQLGFCVDRGVKGWGLVSFTFLHFYMQSTAHGHLRTNHIFTVTPHQVETTSHQNTSKKLAYSSAHDTISSKRTQSQYQHISIFTFHLCTTEKDTGGGGGGSWGGGGGHLTQNNSILPLQEVTGFSRSC